MSDPMSDHCFRKMAWVRGSGFLYSHMPNLISLSLTRQLAIRFAMLRRPLEDETQRRSLLPGARDL
jgi:hypothetical protein